MRDIIEKILVGDILMSNSFLVEGKTKIIEKTNDQNIIRIVTKNFLTCLLYTSPSPRDATLSRMPSSA